MTDICNYIGVQQFYRIHSPQYCRFLHMDTQLLHTPMCQTNTVYTHRSQQQKTRFTYAISLHDYMGDCQNYGPFLGPYYNTGPNTGPNLGHPKRGHNFGNPPHAVLVVSRKMPENNGLLLLRLEDGTITPRSMYEVF